MAEEGARSGGGMQRLVLWLVILALFGVVLWLASERNERHYHVGVQNAQLVIERGRFFPTGSAPSGEKMYAPIPLPDGAHPPSEMEFDDQNALDRWLFDVLTGWARDAEKKGDTHAAATLVDRASALPGLTGAQNGELAAFRNELAWDEAGLDVQQAVQMLDAAVRNLNAVSAGKGPRAIDAQKESERLRGVMQSLKPAQK